MKADRLFLSEADYDQPVSVDDDAMQARNIPSIPAEGIDLPRMKGSFLMMITSIASRKWSFVTASLALGLALACVGLTAFFLTSPPIHAHAAKITYTLSAFADPQNENGYVLLTVSPTPQKNLRLVDQIQVQGEDKQINTGPWLARTRGCRVPLVGGAGLHILYFVDPDSGDVISNRLELELQVDQDNSSQVNIAPADGSTVGSTQDESIISSLPYTWSSVDSSPVENNSTVGSSSTDS